MSDNVILRADGWWYNAETGERIGKARLGMGTKNNAAMVGIGTSKSWEDAHNEAVQVVHAQAQRIEALEAREKQIFDFVLHLLQMALHDQDTVKRMNMNRVGDKSHEKYQPKIDCLTTILAEIERLGGDK